MLQTKKSDTSQKFIGNVDEADKLSVLYLHDLI